MDQPDISNVKLKAIPESIRLEKIDDNTYFTDKRYSTRISNSRMGLMKSGGPAAFFKGFSQGFNPSFILGR